MAENGRISTRPDISSGRERPDDALDYVDSPAWRARLRAGHEVAMVAPAINAKPVPALVTRVSGSSVWVYDGTTRRFDIASGKQVGGPEDLFRRHALMSRERAAEFVQVRAELAGVRQLTGAKERRAVRERSPHVPHYEIDNRQKRQGMRW